MPPAQRANFTKLSTGIATPPPINTAEQSSLSARERLRLHVQRNLQAQEQKARQLAELQVSAPRAVPILAPRTIPVVKAGAKPGVIASHSLELESLYAPIQDTRLGLNDISSDGAGAAREQIAIPLNSSGASPTSGTPPDVNDTPPFEQQEQEWVVPDCAQDTSVVTAMGPVDDEWVRGLIDMETMVAD